MRATGLESSIHYTYRREVYASGQEVFMTQRVARPMKFAAFISIIISVAVMLAACQGAVGPKGDTGDSGDKGDTGEVPTTAINTPPAEKADMPLGTQYFARASLNPDGTAVADGEKIVDTINVSDHFQDPEGLLNLVYQLADLSEDDKKIVDVLLLGPADGGMAPDALDATDPAADPDHEKDGVAGDAYLAIRAKAVGSVTLSLMVKDGLPGGVTTHQIPVMVRATNAPPQPLAAIWTDEAYAKLSRTEAMRLKSTEVVTMDVPSGAFADNDGDALKVTAEIIGTDAAAHMELLGVSIDAAGDLVLTAKKGGPATDNIIVQISATDPYGKVARTGIANPMAIEVKVNTPPANTVWDADPPTGKAVGDKRTLSDIVDKTFSVGSQGNEAQNFITLITYFMDADGTMVDPIIGDDGICNFNAEQPSGDDDEYAAVAFDMDRATITITPKKPGTIQLSVTCTDGKEESVTDSVTVTIRQ